jgi:hypothetical protein
MGLMMMMMIIIIVIIIMSSTPLSSFFSHSYLCPGEAPIIDVKTQGSPKSHPIELRSIISHASLSPHSRLHTLSKKLESRNLPNYFCTLCLWSLTPTTTAITIIITSNHKDNNNNNNPIKVG